MNLILTIDNLDNHDNGYCYIAFLDFSKVMP